MTLPQVRGPWRLYTYTVAEAKEGERFELPQNWVGKIWDPFLRDGRGILASLGIERAIVACFDNYEVFLEAEDFAQFATEFAEKRWRWPFFKVLVRKCRSAKFFGHDRPLYAIDIAILHTAANLALSIRVFSRYPSAMLHPSKYVGGLTPALKVMQMPAM